MSLPEGGATLSDRFFAQSSFASFAVAREHNIVKIRDDAPLELLGPLGCGIQTGAVMAARVAGATTIIAVDAVPDRLDLARELGPPTPSTVVRATQSPRSAQLAGGGVDYAHPGSGAETPLMSQRTDAAVPEA